MHVGALAATALPAARFGQLEVVRVLMEAGAIARHDGAGESALDITAAIARENGAP